MNEDGIKQRLCTLTIGDEDYLPIYGGEAVVFESRVISHLRSAGLGYTVKKNIGYACLPIELTPVGTRLEIEIFGRYVPAHVAPDVLYDPNGAALRN